jgi:hypothetical protein
MPSSVSPSINQGPNSPYRVTRALLPKNSRTNAWSHERTMAALRLTMGTRTAIAKWDRRTPASRWLAPHVTPVSMSQMMMPDERSRRTPISIVWSTSRGPQRNSGQAIGAQNSNASNLIRRRAAHAGAANRRSVASRTTRNWNADVGRSAAGVRTDGASLHDDRGRACRAWLTAGAARQRPAG